MSAMQRLKEEIKALALATPCFGTWLGALILLKKLVLAGYSIEFQGLSAAVMETLVLSKVVLLLERVPLGAWVRSRPAWVDVVLRTALYAAGVVVVLLLKKAFEGRHEHGGFGPALTAVFQHAEAATVESG